MRCPHRQSRVNTLPCGQHNICRMSRPSSCRNKITETDRAVLQLKTQRRQLTGQRKRVRNDLIDVAPKFALHRCGLHSLRMHAWNLAQGYFISRMQRLIQRRASRPLCKQVEDLIARELAIARELIAAKRRERALLALKKKKLREGQLEQIDAYLLNVEQASALQSCTHCADIIHANIQTPCQLLLHSSFPPRHRKVPMPGQGQNRRVRIG